MPFLNLGTSQCGSSDARWVSSQQQECRTPAPEGRWKSPGGRRNLRKAATGVGEGLFSNGVRPGTHRHSQGAPTEVFCGSNVNITKGSAAMLYQRLRPEALD
jgi:hypothetical protein